MKIASFVGTRPEIIKIQPVMKEIQQRGHELIFIHTGQHYDFNMSDIFINELDLSTPNHFLKVKSRSQGVQTGRIITESDTILRHEKPDLVVVIGDTNSGLGPAIASSKLGIKVVHVEAGCRSFDKSMAEEINRTLISHIADTHCAPTDNCKKNLIREGIYPSQIFLTGHPIVDLINQMGNRIIKDRLEGLIDLVQNPYVLITLHRRENITNMVRIRDIFMALEWLSQKIQVIFPCHPHTKKQITRFALKKSLINVKMVDPVSYLQSLSLIKYAKYVMTDSGGVQQEAALLGTPCITLRDATEWIETVDAGINFLAGYELKKILAVADSLDRYYNDIRDRFNYLGQLFGPIGASCRVVEVIEKLGASCR